jgi:hypothetical protein
MFRLSGAFRWLHTDTRSEGVALMQQYGMIYCNDASASQATSVTPVKLTAFTNNGPGLWSTPDAANDRIVVGTDGVFLLMLFTSFSGSNSTQFHFHVRVNGVEIPIGFSRKLSAAGDIGSASAGGLYELKKDDVIEVYVDQTSGTGNVIVREAELVIVR